MSELTLQQKQAIAIAQARARAADMNPVPEKGDLSGYTPAPDHNKFVEFISGGKSPTWESFLYNNETPDPTTLGKIGQIINGIGLEGLSGISPVGQLESAVTAVGSNIPNIMPILSKSSALLEPAKQIAKETAKTDLTKGYQVGRHGAPAVREAWAAGKKEGLPAGEEKASGVENWIRSMFGKNANENEVRAAQDMSSGYKDVLAAQQRTEQAKNMFPRMNMQLPSTESVMLPADILKAKKGLSVEAAHRAGQEATWIPSTPVKAFDLLSTILHPASAPVVLPLSSPRVQANLGYLAGRTISGAEKAAQGATKLNQMLPEASLEDLFKYGLLSPYMAYEQGQ